MLQELLNMEIAPIGSTHYDACRHSSMNAQRSVCSSAVRAQASVLVVAVTAAGAMLTPCLRDAFGTSSFQVVVGGETAEFCRG
jgi:hypothetical protein